MEKLAVNLHLIKKYNVPGPRYTSYPPATQFSESVTWDHLRPLIEAQTNSTADLSLYFHIPFCHSLCWFCGCTNIVTRDQTASSTYISYLQKELNLLIGLVNQERPVLQIHLGGGSPNFLTPSEILKLGQIIKNNFNISQNVEAGVEIDPRTTTLEHLEAFKNAGFNRVSMGIQDHDPQVQKAVHRIQPKELNQQVINWIRQTGFKSLNIDLIYGLPYQNPQSFAKTLNEVIQFNPDRFAVFNFAYVPWLKKHQLALKNLPSPETKLELLKLAIETLTAAGYVYIGMDHFAKSTDELAIAQKNHTLQRNFQGYSTHAGADILAFGMSSISQTDSFYRQNTKDINEYYAFLDSGKIPHKKGYILNNDDILRRKTIMRLMCDMELDFNYMSKMLNIDFPQYFKSELISLKEMEQDELVQILPTGLKVTQMGRLLIRNIAMKFDKYSNATPTTHFSKTI